MRIRVVEGASLGAHAFPGLIGMHCAWQVCNWRDIEVVKASNNTVSWV
jgi:hypothetical protein